MKVFEFVSRLQNILFYLENLKVSQCQEYSAEQTINVEKFGHFSQMNHSKQYLG